MENMDKGLIVPKWVLIVRPKILQIPQNLYAKFVCPSPKVLDFNEKRLHWASVVRGGYQVLKNQSLSFFSLKTFHVKVFSCSNKILQLLLNQSKLPWYFRKVCNTEPRIICGRYKSKCQEKSRMFQRFKKAISTNKQSANK